MAAEAQGKAGLPLPHLRRRVCPALALLRARRRQPDRRRAGPPLRLRGPAGALPRASSIPQALGSSLKLFRLVAGNTLTSSCGHSINPECVEAFCVQGVKNSEGESIRRHVLLGSERQSIRWTSQVQHQGPREIVR